MQEYKETSKKRASPTPHKPTSSPPEISEFPCTPHVPRCTQATSPADEPSLRPIIAPSLPSTSHSIPYQSQSAHLNSQQSSISSFQSSTRQKILLPSLPAAHARTHARTTTTLSPHPARFSPLHKTPTAPTQPNQRAISHRLRRLEPPQGPRFERASLSIACAAGGGYSIWPTGSIYISLAVESTP